MKLLKLCLGSVLIIAQAGNACYAKGVAESDARNIGFNFMKGKVSGGLNNTKDLNLVYTAATPAGEADFYVYNTATGFVMVSAEDAVQPILAFSDEAQFIPEKISPSARYFIGGYQQQIEAVKAAKAVGSAAIADKWNTLAGTTNPKATDRATSVVVGPLLGSLIWDQAPYYNDSCPNDVSGGGLSVTGCVATATAQVMKFWDWPAIGKGSNSYVTATKGFSCHASFAHTYDWSFMPPSIAGHNWAIAQLMWDVGVAVDMDYTANESGAYVISSATGTPPNCAQYALTQYFRYNSTTIKGYSRSSYADAAWLTLIKNDLNSGRPVIYSGSGSAGGHCWVLDGFDDTLGTNYFHANWGWSGTGPDGYYSVDNMNPPALGTGGGSGGFINDQAAIFGIQPYMTANTGGTTVCVGGTAVLSNATPGGVWVSDSAAIATVDSTGKVTGQSVGTVVITYKIGKTTATSTLTVNGPPAQASVTGSDYVCVNRTGDTLTGSVAGGSWSVTNSNAIINTGVLEGLTPGTDTVIYTISNSCGATADSFVVTIPDAWKCDSITAVGTVAQQADVEVYPNPTAGTFVVKLPSTAGVANIAVVDGLGRTVWMGETAASAATISLPNVRAGIYMVRVKTATATYNNLLMVDK
jgi:Peptidase C10 family/Spi protease inhibitor/Secretion system C-terminal sorting domain